MAGKGDAGEGVVASPAAVLSERLGAHATTPCKAMSMRGGEDLMAEELSPLAKRIGMFKKCSDPVEARQKELERKCLVRCVDYLAKHEEQAPKIWSWIMTDMMGTHRDLDREVFFQEHPKTLAKVEKQWKANRLAANSNKMLNAVTLQHLDANDERLIDDLICMKAKLSGTESLPKECQEKAVLDELLKIRVAEVGAESVGSWVMKCVNMTDHTVDWAKGAVFTLVFEGEHARKVRHHSGVEVSNPQYIPLTQDFKIESPCNDQTCTAVRGASSCLLKSLFPEDSAPFQHMLDRKGKVMANLVKQAVLEVGRKKSALGHSMDGDVELADHAKVRRTAALQKARKSLAAKLVKRQRCFELARAAP